MRPFLFWGSAALVALAVNLALVKAGPALFRFLNS